MVALAWFAGGVVAAIAVVALAFLAFVRLIASGDE